MTIEITDPREFRKLPFDTVYHLMRWYSPETKLTFLEELKREVKFKELGINYKESKYFPINRLVLFREQYVTNEKFRNYFLGEISKDNDLNISLQI
jgi:hypothetical protein